MLRHIVCTLALASLTTLSLLACKTAPAPAPALQATPAQGEAAPPIDTNPATPQINHSEVNPPIAKPPLVQPPPPARVQIPTPQPPAEKVQACADKSPALTVNGFAKQKHTLLGQRVRIQGKLMQQAAMCTQVECGQDNPCCNSCGAGYGFFGARDLTLRNSADPTRFTCQGNDCDMKCGMDIPQDKEVIVTGTLTQQSPFYILQDAEVCLP